MNQFTYSAYYRYNGPSRADPLRSEKNAQEVEFALTMFPMDLEHYLSRGAEVKISQDVANSNSSYVTLVTLADESEGDEVVKKCLNAHDLFAKKIRS